MSEVKITLMPGGPLVVEGEVKLIAADGREIEVTQRFKLCRCGHSQRKPFCDGSHKRVGFSDPGLGPRD